MTFKLNPLMSTLAAALALSAASASAVTLRVGNQGDALSMDPHSLNESLQISVVENVYEALVTRDANYKIAPLLATSWKQTSPMVWRFTTKRGSNQRPDARSHWVAAICTSGPLSRSPENQNKLNAAGLLAGIGNKLLAWAAAVPGGIGTSPMATRWRLAACTGLPCTDTAGTTAWAGCGPAVRATSSSASTAAAPTSTTAHRDHNEENNMGRS